MATEFNARLGAAGRRQFYEAVTLVSGAATVTVPCENVDMVQITESGAAASGDTYSANPASAASGTTAVAIDSDNGSSTATVWVYIVGY